VTEGPRRPPFDVVHAYAMCPECWIRQGTPRQPGARALKYTAVSPSLMQCRRCEHTWDEPDPKETSLAWLGVGLRVGALSAQLEPLWGLAQSHRAFCRLVEAIFVSMEAGGTLVRIPMEDMRPRNCKVTLPDDVHISVSAPEQAGAYLEAIEFSSRKTLWRVLLVDVAL